jgi:hypothetical protein
MAVTRTTFEYSGFAATIVDSFSRITERSTFTIYLATDGLGNGRITASSFDAITTKFADWIDDAMGDLADAHGEQYGTFDDDTDDYGEYA